MWAEPLAKILAGSGAVVLLAIITAAGVWWKNVAEAGKARAETATEHAKAATAIALACQSHIADAERRAELQRLTFQIQTRELQDMTVLLHELAREREIDRDRWTQWALDVKHAQQAHYMWDQEVVVEIERLGGHVRPAPSFAVPPPSSDVERFTIRDDDHR